jgi:hypothetical protein
VHSKWSRDTFYSAYNSPGGSGTILSAILTNSPPPFASSVAPRHFVSITERRRKPEIRFSKARIAQSVQRRATGSTVGETNLSLLRNVQAGSGAHPAYSVGTGGAFPWGRAADE